MTNLPPSLYGLLALRQHRLDQAVGIKRIRPLTGLLLGLHREAKKQETLKPAFQYGATQRAKQRMAEIMTETKGCSPERLRELLAEARGLEAFLQQVMKQ